MPNLGLPELLVILVIMILVFGAGKIPQLGRASARHQNFKDASARGEIRNDKKDDSSTKPKNRAPPLELSPA